MDSSPSAKDAAAAADAASTGAARECQDLAFKLGSPAGIACTAGGGTDQGAGPVSYGVAAAMPSTACSAGFADQAGNSAGLAPQGKEGTSARAAARAGPAGTAGGNQRKSGSERSTSRSLSLGLSPEQGLVQMALLVPCRKAMKNRFPLNGTFFQVNEVFLDQATLEEPLQVSTHLFCCSNRFIEPFMITV